MPGTPILHPLTHWPRPLAFVLAGIGSHAATQIGMIRGLTEAGIVPDLVIGGSIGALTAARLALDPATAAEALTTLWAELDRRVVFGAQSSVVAGVRLARAGITGNGTATMDNQRFSALIEGAGLPDTIEELPIRLGIVVTDLLAGRPKLLRSGPMSRSLLASAALPGVYPPVQLDGCFYVDGAVSAAVPARPAIDAGAASLVMVNANPSGMPSRLPGSVPEMLLQATTIMTRNQLSGHLNGLSARHPILHLPATTPSDLSPLDFSRTAELIERSHAATAGFLANLPELADTSRRI